MHGTTLAVVWSVLQFSSLAYGRATLKLDLIQFVNKRGYDYKGGHCDDSWFGKTSDCDHRLTACLDRAQSSATVSSCKYWKRFLGTFHNQNTVTFNTAPYTIEMTSWPGSVKLKVEVDDHDDMSGSDYVGFLIATITATPGSGTHRGTITGDQKTHTRALTLSYEFRVYCAPHYYGSSCLTYCIPQNSEVTGHYTCARDGSKICRAGWAGSDCKESADECRGEPCQNGGTCVDGHLMFTCRCASGFTGQLCGVNIDDCRNDSCHHAGVCHDLINGYACVCARGYFGDRCESDVDFCQNVTCENNGTCKDLLDDFSCSCADGFSGRNCEIEIDECKGIVCENDGECVDLIAGFNCSCQQGYAGRFCEVNIPDCLNHTCENGGTCVDGVANYSCSCPPGYGGDFCEENIDECEMNECENFVRCNDLVNGYECVCLPGYSGDLCRDDVDDCPGHECLNQGRCVDGIAAYSCNCAEWWTGERCGEPAFETEGRSNDIAFRGNLGSGDMEVVNVGIVGYLGDSTSLRASQLEMVSAGKLYYDANKKEVTQILYNIMYGNKQISRDLVQKVVSHFSDAAIKERLSYTRYHGPLHTSHVLFVNKEPKVGSAKTGTSLWITHNWYVIVVVLGLALVILVLLAVVFHRRRKLHTPRYSEEKSVSFVNALYEGKTEVASNA